MATVLVTGASGFLGIHTTVRLLDEGHDVRALVRTPERLWNHLAPLEVERHDPRIEVVTGDMTDIAIVDEAVAGCHLAVHAAATYSYKRRDRAAMRDQNARGTSLVLDAAIGHGCASIVHVSSTAALIRKGATLDHCSPLGEPVGTYTASKVESERIARERQEAGAPVAIVNPGGILGPHDPYLGESNDVLRQLLRGRLPAWPSGGMQWVDVRDAAAVVVAALDHPGGRYLVPGHNLPGPAGPARKVTGRRLPLPTLPAGALAPTLWPGYLTGWSFLPGAVEGVRFLGLGTTVDASHTTAELGIEARPVEDSVRDTVRWMVEEGHLTPRQAGRALD